MRAFLNTFPEQTLKMYKQWAKDKNYHVRRLVSESTRPLLPWSRRIGIINTQTLPLLSLLYADKTRYVTRSVANHLNDISKKEPKLVVETLMNWKKEGRQESFEFAWMSRHALRTLVKMGDKDALSYLGFSNTVQACIEEFALHIGSKNLDRDGVLSFSFTLQGVSNEDLIVDYSIDFIKSNGGTKSKVFKLKKLFLKKGETVIVSKNHRFISDATTYKLYAGMHTLTLQINGKKSESCSFEIM